MNLLGVTKLVFVSVLSKQIKLNDYIIGVFGCGALFLNLLLFSFLVSSVLGIIQAQYTVLKKCILG